MQRMESATFKRWLKSIKDKRVKARILARIYRLLEGLPGDVAPIGGGLSELRLHFGAGYRIYFYQHKDVFVLLLAGGDKSSQREDIANAHKLYAQWRAIYE